MTIFSSSRKSRAPAKASGFRLTWGPGGGGISRPPGGRAAERKAPVKATIKPMSREVRFIFMVYRLQHRYGIPPRSCRRCWRGVARGKSAARYPPRNPRIARRSEPALRAQAHQASPPVDAEHQPVAYDRSESDERK